jgi:hypothetical protein
MAGLIKFNSDNSIDTTNLSESGLNEEYRKIKAVVESKDWKAAVRENFSEDYDQVLLKEDFSVIAMGVFAIGIVIAKIISWLKGKYSLTVKKLLTQSKELNDIYTKVNALLANDKMARFRHRNDRINAEVHSIVMIDKKTGTAYKLYIDNLIYNADACITRLNEIIRYSSTKATPEEKVKTLNNMVDNLIAEVDESMMKYHGFVLTCDPFMKITKFTNQRLEDVLMAYKDWIEFIYTATNSINNNITAQLQYFQLLETAYKKMSVEYSKDKDAKEVVDKLFKYLIKNATASMDFNTRAMVIFNDMIKYYSEELHKIYDIIRS